MATFTGTDGDDVITGTDDADTIDVSQGGHDTVSAEGGDDTIYLGDAFGKGDHIDGGDGHDTVVLAGFYHKTALNHGLTNIESILLEGDFQYNFALSKHFIGKGQAITVDASAQSAGVTIDASAVSKGDLTLIGSSGDDALAANDSGKAHVSLYGGIGNDTLDDQNGVAAHILDGGSGNDHIFAGLNDAVIGGDGDDYVGYANNAFVNFDGGAGNDQFTVFNATISSLHGGEGTDTLISENLVTFDITEFSAASSGFEVIDMARGAMYGTSGDDHFDFSGFTFTRGGMGFSAEDGNDTVIGGDEIDGFFGDNGNDLLIGGGGDDNLNGDTNVGNGDDILIGGLGQDTLTGDGGGDMFVYLSIEDSLPGPHQRDIITDFQHLRGDKIDLSAIDADITQGGDQAFHLGGNSFTGSAGELIQHVDQAGHTILQGDVDGDGVADFAIQLDNAPHLVASDFVL